MKQLDDHGNNKDLVMYRIESAKNDLRSAIALRDIDDYRGANNRAYYAVFHAITAVHGLKSIVWRG